MLAIRFFQLFFVAGVFLSGSCGSRDLSDKTSNAARDMNTLVISDESVSDQAEDQPSVWEITKGTEVPYSFSTFTSLLEKAGLDETLKSEQPITVFVPDEEAFKLLGEGSLIELLKEDNRGFLEELLLTHVISGIYRADEFYEGEIKTTLSGRSFTVHRDSIIKLNNATVITPDIVARNGIIHVVDQVILSD